MKPDDYKVQEVSEIAQRVLGELMLSSPQRPTLQTTEGLAAAVALYLEKLSDAMHSDHKRVLKLFTDSVEEYLDLTGEVK